MRIIMIRHGDPDYEHDALTEKGRREAEILSERVKKWNVAAFYCSPLGRAQATAAPTLAKTGRTAETKPWLREFLGRAYRPDKDAVSISWDFLPAYWTEQPELFDLSRWQDAELVRSLEGREITVDPSDNAWRAELVGGTDVKTAADAVAAGLDGLLAEYGYRRYHRCYTVDEHREDTIVFFCHFGVSSVMLSHLLNIPPVVLLHGLFLPTASVSVVQTEEREPGIAYFRCQTLGDVSHLLAAGEPVNGAAAFCEVFQDR